MTMISNLPRDLVEEILSRVPVKSMRAMQSTCKKWNTFSKDGSFRKKHLVAQSATTARKREFQVVMMMDYKVYLISINPQGIYNNVESCIKLEGKLVDSDKLDVSQVYHCDGLLLCITADYKSFMVLNPYWGQTRWFEPISCHLMFRYAIGYEDNKSCRNHKILRFIESWSYRDIRCELYYVNSKSCKERIISSDWVIPFYQRGVSVKGNTYWFAQEKYPVGFGEEIPVFLLCFDFTTERFGPRLPLPFHSYYNDTVTLSSVRDELLAVLFQQRNTLRMRIWISNKIEPNAVSWSKLFLEVDMEPLTNFQFRVDAGSFFVDEEKNVAVVFDIDRKTRERNLAYIIGEDGYFKKVNVKESSNIISCPLICSYVPSLVQILD